MPRILSTIIDECGSGFIILLGFLELFNCNRFHIPLSVLDPLCRKGCGRAQYSRNHQTSPSSPRILPVGIGNAGARGDQDVSILSRARRHIFSCFKKDDSARYFGPFVNSVGLRNTVALARKQFNLRGCRVFTPGEGDYKHCLYAHLKHCTAPCVGNVTRKQYLQQVMAACNFLEGQCREMQGQLEAEMKKAAAAQDFEKAADLRDLLQPAGHLEKDGKIRARAYNLPLSINPANDLVELAKILDLPAPPQRIEGFDISNISGTFAVASLVSFKNGRPDRANYRRFKIKTVEGQDDFASMAEVVRRRYSRLKREPKPMPDLILIDGGKGQLGMACAELKKLGLGKNSRHRPGEGVRGDLSAGKRLAAAAGP